MEVTNANKQEYLNLLAQYKLVSRVKEELDYFLKGKYMYVLYAYVCLCVRNDVR